MSDPTIPKSPSPRRRRLSLSLRAMMVLVLLIGLPMGWKARRASLQRRAIAEIKRAGGAVRFDYQTTNWAAKSPPGPAWLRRAIGDEYFREVSWVEFSTRLGDSPLDSTAADAAMSTIADFDHLIGLIFLNGRMTSTGFRHVARLQRLELLQVEGIGLGDDDLALIRNMTQLKILHLDNMPDGKKHLTGAGLAHLGGMTRMETLVITGARLDRPDDLKPLAGMTSLVDLVLDRSPRDEACLSHLRGLKKLDFLELRHTKVSDAGMKMLAGMDSLIHLYINGDGLSDGGLAELARHPHLVTLQLFGLGRATDTGVAQLFRSATPEHPAPILRLDKLLLPRAEISGRCFASVPAGLCPRVIDLSDSAVTDDGLACLPADAKVDELFLAGTKITATGLSRLATLNRLISLDLSRTSIDGAGLFQLTAIPGLAELNLSRTGISDADLPMLYPAKSLKFLDLTRTKVTPEGIKAISDRMNLTVEPIHRYDP